MDNPLLENKETSDEIWKLLQQISSQVNSLTEDTKIPSNNSLFDTQTLDNIFKENLQLKRQIERLKTENKALRAENENLKATQTKTRRRSLSLSQEAMSEAESEPNMKSEQEDISDSMIGRGMPRKNIDTMDDTVVSTEDVSRSQRSPEIGPLGLCRFALSDLLDKGNRTECEVSSSQLSVETSSSPTITSSSPVRHRSIKSNELDFGDAYISKVISGECHVSQLSGRKSFASDDKSQILIPDSQNEDEREETGMSICKKRPLQDVIPNKLLYPSGKSNSIMKGIVDLTKNPITNLPWWPEDFKVNPVVNFGKTCPFKMRKLDPTLLHPALRIQYSLQRKHIQDEALQAFNKLAGSVKSADENNKTRDTKNALRTARQALQDPLIDPVFKFELNRTNYMHNKAILGSVNSNKVKLWLDMTDSPPGEDRSSFPNTQELKEDRKKAEKRAKLIGLQRLFQAIYMVEPLDKSENNLIENKENVIDMGSKICEHQMRYAQVGKFLFREDLLNKAVQEDNFTIDKHLSLIHI